MTQSCFFYMTAQHPLDCCGAYGSSRLSTEPHIDGTMKSFVFVQYCISDIEASETLIRGRSRSSRRRELSSLSRRSLRSAMDCFLFFTSPCDLISYAAGITLNSSDRMSGKVLLEGCWSDWKADAQTSVLSSQVSNDPLSQRMSGYCKEEGRYVVSHTIVTTVEGLRAW